MIREFCHAETVPLTIFLFGAVYESNYANNIGHLPDRKIKFFHYLI